MKNVEEEIAVLKEDLKALEENNSCIVVDAVSSHNT